MSKVHIALVGGQTAPVYNGIIYANPDKVILVCSANTEEEAARIKEEVALPCEFISFEPQNISLIFNQIEELKVKLNQDDEFSLNLTSGTKAWTLAFYSAFKDMNKVKLLLIDQNNNIWDFVTRSSEVLQFDMDANFRLYGNELDYYRPFTSYTEQDYKSMLTVESARSYNQSQFNSLTTILTKEWAGKLTNQRKGTFELPRGAYAEWEKDDFVRLYLTTRYGDKEFCIESPNAIHIAFNSGWFEYKIARMLSHWNCTKEIRMNCIFPVTHTQNDENAIKYPKNEVDIIVNIGNKILFVECKTKINSSNDIDKFRTVVKNYGGMGSKAIFVTDIAMTDIQQEKCKESDIIPFSLQNADTNKEQALFKCLNGEINKINKK